MAETIYHRVIPESVCESVKGLFGKVLGLEIDWNLKTSEAPIEPQDQ